MGAEHVTLALRERGRAARAEALAERLGIRMRVQALGETLPAVDAAVSTLPAAAQVVPAFADAPARILDADYALPSGSRYLATLPVERVIDGRAMLLGQAVLQVRAFAHGDVDEPLADEERVRAAMAAAL